MARISDAVTSWLTNAALMLGSALFLAGTGVAPRDAAAMDLLTVTLGYGMCYGRDLLKPSGRNLDDDGDVRCAWAHRSKE